MVSAFLAVCRISAEVPRLPMMSDSKVNPSPGVWLEKLSGMVVLPSASQSPLLSM